MTYLDPTTTNFLFVAVGAAFFLCGYAIGKRFKVGALLVLVVLCGLGAFLAGMGLGASVLFSFALTALVIVFLQIGYFTAVVVSAAASRRGSAVAPAESDKKKSAAIAQARHGSP